MISRDRRGSRRWAIAFVVTLLAGCSSTASESATKPTSEAPTSGSRNTVVVDGLDRPTQIAVGPDDTLLIAQLAGDENESTGEVLAVDVARGTRRTLLNGLDKPTGVAWSRGVLWVMVRRSLLRVDWPDATAHPGDPVTVLQNLPFNDRSEGTLTVLASGRILYETSGSITNGTVDRDSGTLWTFDPATNTSTPIAVGIKNAYAHTQLVDGRILTSDIGDNISDAPVEEIDVVNSTGAPTQLGWPKCPGDRDCPDVTGPLAVFPPSSTPTGIAVIGDVAFVTLFVTGQLMRVPMTGWVPGHAPVLPVEVVAGLDGPHTVLARADGTLWISEHLGDRVVSLRP